MALLALSAAPAQALVINPIFDSSITSLANAAVVESAFNTAAQQFDKALSADVTVNIKVSWGSVGGRALPGGDIGASLDNAYGMAYADVTGYLTAAAAYNPLDTALATAVANLPVNDPSNLDNYLMPYAEGKALGLAAPNQSAIDGYIGFKNISNFDFNPVGGITGGYYDFQGLASHEIEEVLGRVTGLQGNRSYATVFDVYRYTAPDVSSFSSSAHAYFSIDGGITNLGNFNYAGGGDRSDWLTTGNSTDVQNAYFYPGRLLSLSANDLIGLDALGWNSAINPQGWGPQQTPNNLVTYPSFSAVPEPAAWTSLLVGFGAVGATKRRRRLSVV